MKTISLNDSSMRFGRTDIKLDEEVLQVENATLLTKLISTRCCVRRMMPCWVKECLLMIFG